MVRVTFVDGRQVEFQASSVAQLKALIAQTQGVAAEQQVLMAAGVPLSAFSAVPDQVFMIADVDGGAKKKKKVYSKPKKAHHKNKKIKLRILNLYKIEGDNQIVRLRRECTNCGGAYFMANHADRYYCGNCHKTVARE